MYLYDIFIGQRLVWFIVFGVLQEHLVHVGAGILVKLVAAAEYYQSYFTITQNRQFISLLHHTKLPLVKGHLKRKKDE